jgi:hypothetical protein
MLISATGVSCSNSTCSYAESILRKSVPVLGNAGPIACGGPLKVIVQRERENRTNVFMY